MWILKPFLYQIEEPVWPWSYGSLIYSYQCNQCLSPLMSWVWLPLRARCITLCDIVCQWLAAGLWFSPGLPVSSTNKSDYDITKIFLKVALNTMKQTNKYIRSTPVTQVKMNFYYFSSHICQLHSSVILYNWYIITIKATVYWNHQYSNPLH